MAVSFWRALEKKPGGRPRLGRSHHSRTNLVPKTPTYQNSYHLEPNNPFRTDPVDDIVQKVMNRRLENVTYNATTAPKLCSEVAQEIRQKIMKLEFDRYKIVVLVTMVEKSSQGVNTNLGCVWDVARDNYSSYSFEAQTFYAYCIVAGVYYE